MQFTHSRTVARTDGRTQCEMQARTPHSQPIAEGSHYTRTHTRTHAYYMCILYSIFVPYVHIGMLNTIFSIADSGFEAQFYLIGTSLSRIPACLCVMHACHDHLYNVIFAHVQRL